MSIHAALNHVTHYTYDRLVNLGPQVVRLRPAPHCRTAIKSYSLRVEPAEHFINWQQDPFGNYLARLVFPEKTTEFKVTVDLVVEMAVYNPFDFFLEPGAENFPFRYEPLVAQELAPYLVVEPITPLLESYLATIDRKKQRTIDFLVGINQQLQHDVKYLIRMEPGVQTPEQTLEQASGSCRDSAWLLVQVLRHLGLAARFVSGYLLQLKPDVKPLEGPVGAAADFTDLHAWAEVYVPGAGWLGLEAVRHGMAAIDGRANPSPLARRVWMHCGDEREELQAWCAESGQFEFAQLARAVFECEASDPVAARLLLQATECLEELALAIDPRGRLPLAVSGSIGERLAPRMRPAVRSRLCAAKGSAAEGALMLARRALQKETESAL